MANGTLDAACVWDTDCLGALTCFPPNATVLLQLAPVDDAQRPVGRCACPATPAFAWDAAASDCVAPHPSAALETFLAFVVLVVWLGIGFAAGTDMLALRRIGELVPKSNLVQTLVLLFLASNVGALVAVLDMSCVSRPLTSDRYSTAFRFKTCPASFAAVVLFEFLLVLSFACIVHVAMVFVRIASQAKRMQNVQRLNGMSPFERAAYSLEFVYAVLQMLTLVALRVPYMVAVALPFLLIIIGLYAVGGHLLSRVLQDTINTANVMSGGGSVTEAPNWAPPVSPPGPPAANNSGSNNTPPPGPGPGPGGRAGSITSTTPAMAKFQGSAPLQRALRRVRNTVVGVIISVSVTFVLLSMCLGFLLTNGSLTYEPGLWNRPGTWTLRLAYISAVSTAAIITTYAHVNVTGQVERFFVMRGQSPPETWRWGGLAALVPVAKAVLSRIRGRYEGGDLAAVQGAGTDALGSEKDLREDSKQFRSNAVAPMN